MHGYFKRLVGLRLLLINYLMHALGLHGEKKSMENRNIKSGHSEDDTSDSSKLGNFYSLGRNFYLKTD